MLAVPHRNIRMDIHGQGELEIYGALDAGTTIVFCGRDDFRRDDEFLCRLIGYFTRQGFRVVQYLSRADLNFRRTNPPWMQRVPKPFRSFLKLLILLVHPFQWGHLSPSHRARAKSLEYRLQSLQELVPLLGESKVVLAGRSSGARLASLAADLPGVEKVVCMGYPFQHPAIGPDPARVRHLATVKSPVLVLQGRKDPYGGEGIEDCNELSPSIQIQFLDTDHSFHFEDEEWLRLLRLLDQFVGSQQDSGRAVQVS